MNKNFLTFSKEATLWLIISASFFIGSPIAFGSISLGLFLIFWMLSGDYRAKLLLIIHNPGAQISLLFLGIYAIGMTYSSAEWHDSLHYLTKYAKLLIIPLVIGVMVSERYRKYAVNAFLIGVIGYLLVSYLNRLGFFSFRVMHNGSYLAFGLYLMLRNAKRMSGQYRKTWLLLSAFTIFNILFISESRTGAVTMLALLFVFLLETYGIRALFYLVGMLLLAAVLYKSVPEVRHSRMMGIREEAATNVSSAGQRIEMYTNTLKLIKQHPIFGGGTGSIQGEYTTLIKDDANVFIRRVTNPHNQYLLTTQELGIFGLIMLVLFWMIHWRQSFRLTNSGDGNLLRALVITSSLGSAFNSLLLDSGDGRMYCIMTGVLLSGYELKRVHKIDKRI
jgi:O-antigen ligase